MKPTPKPRPSLHLILLSLLCVAATHAQTTVAATDVRPASDPPVTATPSLLTFSTPKGTTTPAQTIKITNGSQTSVLTISRLTISGFAFVFAQGTGHPCLTPVQPGQSCTESVVFSPDANIGVAGKDYTSTGSVTFGTDSNPSLATVSLIGTATAIPTPPVASASPASLAFTATAGTTSATQTVNITNTGGGTLTFSGISSDTPAFSVDATSCLAASLNANQSCSFGVKFSPAATSPPNVTGSITITTNGTPSTKTVGLTGNVPPPAGTLSATPASLTFNTTAGTPATQQIVTLSNTGGGSLTVSSIKLGADATGFALDLTSCFGATLTAGQSCKFGVTFNPAANSPPTITSSITITDTGTPSTLTIAITGNATPAARPSSPSPRQASR